MRKLWQAIGRAIFYAGWPVFYLYLRGTTRTRALIIHKNEILLVKNWLSDNRYGLPGGGMHAGEQLLAAMQRELAEEVGLHTVKLKHVGSEPVQELGFHFFVQFFYARLRSKPALKPQFIEISEARWLPLDHLSSVKCKPEVRLALELSNKK